MTRLDKKQRRTQRDDLESELLAGLNSPMSEMTDANWSRLREAILSRSSEIRSKG